MVDENLKHDCVLCEGIDSKFLNLAKTYEGLNHSPILFETDNFLMIPDKYPLRVGHILVVPKIHINSFAEFGEAESNEIGDICNIIQNIVGSESYIIFEHGTSKIEQYKTDPSIKSIFHAHLQVIPDLSFTYKDFDNFLRSKNVNLINGNNEYRNLKEFIGKYVGNKDIANFLRINTVYDSKELNSIESYLFVKTSDNFQFFFPEGLITPKLPSQFTREALSSASDTPEWNWKIPMSNQGIAKYFDRFAKTVEMFKK